MKSKLLRGNLSRGKMKSVNISIKYSSVAVTKFVCKEIWQKNHLTLLQAERKAIYYIPDIRSIILSTNNKSVMLQIFTLRGKTSTYYIILQEKKSIILHHVLPNSPENVFLRPLLF